MSDDSPFRPDGPGHDPHATADPSDGSITIGSACPGCGRHLGDTWDGQRCRACGYTYIFPLSISAARDAAEQPATAPPEVAGSPTPETDLFSRVTGRLLDLVAVVMAFCAGIVAVTPSLVADSASPLFLPVTATADGAGLSPLAHAPLPVAGLLALAVLLLWIPPLASD